MKAFLIVLTFLAFFAGFGTLALAKSAIHEIQAYIWFVICAILFSSAGVIGAIDSLKEKLMQADKESSN